MRSLETESNGLFHQHIFIYSSINNQLKIGYGAYFVVSELGCIAEVIRRYGESAVF